MSSITGVKETLATLKGIEPKLRKKVLQKSLREAAKPILEQARDYVPWDTGLLHDSLKILAATRIGDKRHKVGVRVTATAPHAHLVEYGTVAQSGDPFLRPAYDDNQQATPDRIAAAIKVKLPEVVK